MGNLLQMSITSGQDTDSRQFTLAANSHRLAGETYDANGNRTCGSADGFTSVSYNILNLPETVTAGGRTINYLYSARWSTPDPLAEKYYAISPYAYCAGNPVNLVDPEGLELFIGQYKYKDGKLYDSEDNVVKEEQMDDFTKKVYNALCSIATTKTGQEVIDTLQNAKYGYKIQKGEKSSFSKQNVQAACYYAYPKEVQDHLNQIGSGGTIFWNEEGALLPTENGGQINSTSDLFHEMSHAFDAFHGMLDNTKFEELKKEEWQAVYRENLFRHEFKLPLRTHYYPVINIVGKFIGGTGPYMLKEGKPLKPSWYNL